MMGFLQSGFDSLAAVAAMMPLQPPAASSIANSVDQLYYADRHHDFFHRPDFFDHFLLHGEVSPEVAQGIGHRTHTAMAGAGLDDYSFADLRRDFRLVLEPVHPQRRPPAASTEIFVIGKQWMWHLQHPEGPREINELHVPVGVPVKLTMTSQDVIHDFYIPAFRVKKDVLPGRYTSMWFEATETGTFHLFCAQYCGTNHSEMIGWVYVMSPQDYAAWLAGGERSESMAQQGERMFNQYGCDNCHVAGRHGPRTIACGNLWHRQKLQTGETETGG